ncbi:hypothetical protein Dda_7429 [Drechslerella dactyloides]|uniref:Uncharacterized protein n=1 Tax=Drechslerella dactyloides TaxID=74499 RepID=A0AAD6ISJ9_DREDA|nr:hypothetical protein Dda_7429 [Drechslerella dactyloides]
MHREPVAGAVDPPAPHTYLNLRRTDLCLVTWRKGPKRGIRKPKLREKENITNKWLEEKAFSIPYYQNKTGNWTECAGDALTENQSILIGPETITRFRDQPEPAIEHIYNAFLRKLEERKMDPEYYSLIKDMLASTEHPDVPGYNAQRRWLFVWAANEKGKHQRRMTKKQKLSSSAGEEHPEVHDHSSEEIDATATETDRKKKPLRVQDLVNENETKDIWET